MKVMRKEHSRNWLPNCRIHDTTTTKNYIMKRMRERKQHNADINTQ